MSERGRSSRQRPAGAPDAPGSEAMQSAIIVEALEREIVRGERPAGEPIRQEALAKRFGVSRTPIREALRVLEERGLVERRGRSGVSVHLATPQEYQDLFRVRAELEGFAAELAAPRISRPHLRDLETASRQFKELIVEYRALPADHTEDLARLFEDVSAVNDSFHDTVAAAAACPPVVDCILQLRRRVPRELAWISMKHDPGLLFESGDDHEAVIEALRARDGKTARARLTEHVLAAGATIMYWLEDRDRSVDPAGARDAARLAAR